MNGGVIETSSVDDVRWLRSKQYKTATSEQNENKYFNSANGPPAARSLSSVPSSHHDRGSFKRDGLRRRGVSETAHITHPNAILNRKDIFYPGSVENLPEYRSNPDLYRSLTSLHRPLSAHEELKKLEPSESLWGQ